ncbi:putative methyltransferase, partial [Haemophilus influenzae]
MKKSLKIVGVMKNLGIFALKI